MKFIDISPSRVHVGILVLGLLSQATHRNPLRPSAYMVSQATKLLKAFGQRLRILQCKHFTPQQQLTMAKFLLQ